ncbi:MAG: sulfotransferase [Flavobacteriaceae bacterium]|nr:sulfotransferase [Flavobacteriaceae bacterium]
MNLKKYIKAFLMFVNRGAVKPVFILGCGHSGTSILLSILDNHESIYAIQNETSLFYESKVNILAAVFSWHKKGKTLGKSYIVEKTPMHIYKINEILTLFPNARVLLMLRDGRDVACSIRERTGDFKKGINKWVKVNEEGFKYWTHPRVKVVRLEELTKDGPKVLTNVCKFIGIEYQPTMLEKQGKQEKLFYTKTLTDTKDFDTATTHQAHMNRRNWQINQGLFSSTERWKKELSKEEVDLFNECAKENLERYGYVSDAVDMAI